MKKKQKNNNTYTIDNDNTQAVEITVEQLVQRCGLSGLRQDRLALVIQSRYPHSYSEILIRLQPGGDLFDIYHAAVAQGNADTLFNLHQAITPGNAEAYTPYSRAIRDNAITEAIEKNFGIK